MYSLRYRMFRTITCRYTRVADSGFPHHTIASLRQVGMMGLTPLQRMSKSAHGLKLKSRCSLGSPHTHTHTHTHTLLREELRHVLAQCQAVSENPQTGLTKRKLPGTLQ